MSRPSLQEKIDFVRQRWDSFCQTGCPTEDEVRQWLENYNLNYVLHGIKIALLEHSKALHRNEAGYQEDECLARAEEVMRSEQEGYEQRRAA